MAYMHLDDDRLLFLPLGGSGEIGMNLNLYGHMGKWLMVDCGMAFAGDNTPGVDLIFPDTHFLKEECDNLLGLVVTHGHEDHIGAIPHLWSQFRCPIFATAFTAGLIREKLKEANLVDEVDLIIVDDTQELSLGPFDIRYIPLAHSIAEGNGLAIKTSKGTLFHTGDWKLDADPLIGPLCPSQELTALGQSGVLAVIGDSTNVFNEVPSGSEKAVQESLLDIVQDLTGRVVITTFASNVARLETISKVAEATGRHLILLGRSMIRIVKIAHENGYLGNFTNLVDQEEADYLPKDNVLIVCTGCQGEPRAAISRIARDDHRHLHLAEGDNVIFSSKIIPGNEVTLGHLFNNLAAKGVNVITEKDAFVHVSGHPGRQELRQMYGWTKPKAIIPVHGEYRHLKRHFELAHEIGVANTIIPKNGDVIEIDDTGTLKAIDKVPVGRFALDGSEIVPDDSVSIVERRRMITSGIVTVSLIFTKIGDLMAEPVMSLRGLPKADDDNFYDSVLDEIEAGVERMRAKARLNDDAVEEVVRIAVRRFCRKSIGKNPTVDTLITREHHLTLTRNRGG